MKKNKSEESDLVNQYRSSKPQFKSADDAIKALTAELNQICFEHGKTVAEMRFLAREPIHSDPVLLMVHRLLSQIRGLSEINERKTRLEHIRELPKSP